MQPVESCLHCQFLCRILKALFYQTSSKINIFLQKNAKFLSAGGSTPRPLNSRSIENFWPRAWLQHIRIFEVLCLKFLSSSPTKIFWIRHWLQAHLMENGNIFWKFRPIMQNAHPLHYALLQSLIKNKNFTLLQKTATCREDSNESL